MNGEVYPVFALTPNGWGWFPELSAEENPAIDIHLSCDHVMRTRFQVLHSGKKVSAVAIVGEEVL